VPPATLPLSPDLTTTVFYGAKVPRIRLDKYLARLVRYVDAYVDETSSVFSTGAYCLLWGAALIDRLARVRGLRVDPMNVHRLFMVATLVAFKMVDDEPCSNEYFANVGGVDLAELNQLEGSLLVGLEFRACVAPSELRAAFDEFCPGALEEGRGGDLVAASLARAGGAPSKLPAATAKTTAKPSGPVLATAVRGG